MLLALSPCCPSPACCSQLGGNGADIVQAYSVCCWSGCLFALPYRAPSAIDQTAQEGGRADYCIVLASALVSLPPARWCRLSGAPASRHFLHQPGRAPAQSAVTPREAPPAYLLDVGAPSFAIVWGSNTATSKYARTVVYLLPQRSNAAHPIISRARTAQLVVVVVTFAFSLPSAIDSAMHFTMFDVESAPECIEKK